MGYYINLYLTSLGKYAILLLSDERAKD